MFFRETTGIPEVRTLHREIAADANDALAEILGGLPGTTHLQAEGTPPAFAMASEVIRGGLTELVIWWSEHPDVPRVIGAAEAERIDHTASKT